jgi:hypothetical protein
MLHDCFEIALVNVDVEKKTSTDLLWLCIKYRIHESNIRKWFKSGLNVIYAENYIVKYIYVSFHTIRAFFC